MDQLKEIFDLLNLGAPFYYAFAALTLFYFFDSQASERANSAISNWLKSTDYDASDVSRALVELFDRIYTYPLWQWRAVARCIAISTVVTAVTIWQMYYPTFYFMMYSCCGVTDQFSQQIVINIISDYLSLYLVRHWLKSLRFPIIALILARRS